jgi:hypothetical protein
VLCATDTGATDTNASTECSNNEVLLGNASCQAFTSIWHYNQTATEFFYNMTDTELFYNQTATEFFYNMSDGGLTEWDSNIAWTNQTNTYTENQNITHNITFHNNNTICMDLTCSAYISYNGSTIIIKNG